MKRYKHGLSNTKLLSCDTGQLVPIGWLPVLPGDSIQQATRMLLRTQPLNAPVMHRFDVTIMHYMVPYRIIWDNFTKFITGGPDGFNASTFPTITTPVSTGFTVGSLADYLGIKPGVASRTVSALPFRAYALIWNKWFRDQDLCAAVTVSTADGADTTTSTVLKRVMWQKDYFTTTRPWTQKGPEITIPLGTVAPVVLTDDATTAMIVKRADTHATIAAASSLSSENTNGFLNNAAAVRLALDPNGTLEADLSDASAATVNTFRFAMAMQRYEEARAQFGSEYVDYLNYLGVRSSDARLQHPEYLGGGRQTIQFSEVLQTAEGADPVGELRGHGIAAVGSNRYRRFVEEHGLIMSFMYVRPKTIYADGLQREWNRRTKEDFWQKELQHIGQQEILNKEVDFAHTTPDGVFGYQDRYDEYRRVESTIAGEFRTTLDYWHAARIFDGGDGEPANPALNESFVTCTPTDRIFASQDTNELLAMASHSIQARRLVSPVGTAFIS